MKQARFRKKILLWGLALAPLLIAAVVYRSLPDQIPVHWDLNGTVSTGPKATIWLTSSLGVIVTAGMLFTRHIDPKRENYSRFAGAYETFLVVFNLFMLAMNLFTLTETFRPGTLDAQVFVMVLVGILFAVIGNLMPKFKHNYFIGIRTPWTLASETVWYRTHRLCGPLWVIGGLMMLLAAFLPATAAITVTLADVAVLVVIPYVMSYLWFKEEQN